jgi:hypothetical protein
MERLQLELFSERAPTHGSSTASTVQRVAPSDMSDAALIVALPDSVRTDACALAAEAGRRQLSGAVTALVTLCNRFVGFGVDCRVPEQEAALEALADIGGPDATLAVATTAASKLGVIFPPDVVLLLLRHSNPSVRAAACACVRAGHDIVVALIDLLDDLDREVSTAAACALGRMGRMEARDQLNERPSPRVIDAVVGVADEEAIVFLARIGRTRPNSLFQFPPRSTRSIKRGQPLPRPGCDTGCHFQSDGDARVKQQHQNREFPHLW